jgi:hypothetical protein
VVVGGSIFLVKPLPGDAFAAGMVIFFAAVLFAAAIANRPNFLEVPSTSAAPPIVSSSRT